MGRKTTKTIKVGSKNTVIKAIPKPLFSIMLRIQKEMQDKKNKNGKKKRVTLLEAGLELSRRVR